MKLYIKNMVSLRCKIVVKGELQKMNLPYTILELGTVEITDDISESEYEQLKLNLLVYGFELLNDRKMIIVEKIKRHNFTFTFWRGN